MHSHLGNAISFLGKVDEMDGNPDLLSPSTQSTFGMNNQQAQDHCFSYSNTVHYAMTQLSLRQGLREWKELAVEAVTSELQQMHDKNVYAPVMANDLTRQEKMAAL